MQLTLRNRFAIGSRLYYLSSTSATQKILEGDALLGSQTAGWKMEVHQRVLDVEPDGAAHILYRVLPVSLSPEAAATGLSIRKQVAYMLVTPLGHVIERSEASLIEPCVFPEQAVGVGDCWSVETELRFPFLAHPVPFSNRHTLAGIDDIDGVSCARINVHAESGRILVPGASDGETVEVEVENEGSIWFDHDDGTLVCVRMTTRAVPTIGGIRYDTLTTLTQQLISQPVPAGVN